MPPAITRSPQQLGHVIQGFRKARNLTQIELARLSDQRQEMISKIETGQGGVALSTIYEVLAALGLEMTIAPRTRSSASDIASIF